MNNFGQSPSSSDFSRMVDQMVESHLAISCKRMEELADRLTEPTREILKRFNEEQTHQMAEALEATTSALKAIAGSHAKFQEETIQQFIAAVEAMNRYSAQSRNQPPREGD